MKTPYLFTAETPMAGRLREMDWESTPLGPTQQWDAALKTLVPIVLASSQPMFIVWGPSRTLIYNDGYAEILAAKPDRAISRDAGFDHHMVKPADISRLAEILAGAA